MDLPLGLQKGRTLMDPDGRAVASRTAREYSSGVVSAGLRCVFPQPSKLTQPHSPSSAGRANPQSWTPTSPKPPGEERQTCLMCTPRASLGQTSPENQPRTI